MGHEESGKIPGLVDGKRVVILTHNNADADAIGSAIALKEELLGKRCREAVIVAPQCMSRGASKLARELGEDVSVDIPILEFEACVIVDTLSPEQLVPYRLSELPRPIVVIDHHYEREELKTSAAVYISGKRPSCAEVVIGVLRDLGITELSEKSRLALMAAMIADTQHLSHAKVATLKDIIGLNATDEELERARELIAVPPDVSEKIACLKAMRSVEFERIPTPAAGEVILGWCTAGSFESSVANVLLRAGADVAVVAAEKEGFVRISGRTRLKTIHLGRDVFEPLGGMHGGSGGGHAAAASANARVQLKDGIRSCTSLIRKLLGAKPR